jgi:paraquat-inducible protein B
VFIDKPYDDFVTSATRFWQASGIDMSIDSDGVKLRTESLSSILEGGISFQALPGAQPPGAPANPPPAPVDSIFTLFIDRERAMRPPDTEVRSFVMYFKGSLRGLSVGAPVDLRGITIGEVKSLSVEYDRDGGDLRFPVQVDIFPQRIRGRNRRDHSQGSDEASETAGRALLDSLVAHGMRAELKTGSLLTGQKFVALDFHTEVPPDHVGWNAEPPVFPTTTTGGLDEIQDSVGSIAKKLDKVPFDQMTARLMTTMATLDETLKKADSLIGQFDGTIAPQINATLTEAQGALKNAKDALGQNAPLQTDLSSTLLELSRAAKSVSALVDYLDRHPESLLRGKPKDPP